MLKSITNETNKIKIRAIKADIDIKYSVHYQLTECSV